MQGGGREDTFTKLVNDAVGRTQGDGSAPVDFFTPLNEMDPLVRNKPKVEVFPEYRFRIFNLAGVGAAVEDEREYLRVMNLIVRGDCIRLSEETYHTKDGDIKVFLRWLEFKKEDLDKMKSDMKSDEDKEAAKLQEVTDTESKKKKRRTKAEVEEEELRKTCPAVDPEIAV